MKPFLALFALLAVISWGLAYENETVWVKVSSSNDGIVRSSIETCNITVAKPPVIPTVNIYVTRGDSTSMEPFVGPYLPGEGIKIHVNSQLPQGSPCLDWYSVSAPVWNSTTKQVEFVEVVNTSRSSMPWCKRGWLNADYPYEDGWPKIEPFEVR